MPKQNSECHCIVCGRPSGTKVCMHCFFNYDYRTYNSQELERKHKTEEDYDPRRIDLDIIQEVEFLQEEENHYLDTDDPDNEDSSGHGFGLSWLPKFPRFS